MARDPEAAEPRRVADPLIVKELSFLGGMATAGGWRPTPGLPEIAFAGRSNVGKSSLINRLLRRKKIARVSNTPGRTREINFFLVNEAFVVVDLPGYGYARVSKTQQAEWRPMIEGYLRSSPTLRGVVQLLDARRDPTDDDRKMLQYLAETGVPTLVVLTKMDKLSRSESAIRVGQIAEAIDMDPEQIVPFSAVTGEGRDELAASVAALVYEAAPGPSEP